MLSPKTHPARLILFLVTTIFLIFASDVAFAAIWYVDAAGSGDGTSWPKAVPIIQEAIDAAVDGDEIWVKAGTYAFTSQIIVDKAVAIYGGFAGDEHTRDKRDWEKNVI